MSSIRLDRRQLVQGALIMAGMRTANAAPTVNSSAKFAYTGCRTTKERGARGKGINVFRIDPAGTWSHHQLVGDLINPSYLAFDRSQRFLYSVHGDFSQITAFRVDDETGRLTLINEQSTGGKNPVHLVPDPSNRFMLVANYASGNVGVLPIRQDGGLDTLSGVLELPGSGGPHKVEQTSAHPHHTVFSPGDRFLIVPDKGVDRVFVLEFDAQGPSLKLSDFAATRPGAGPRHVSFHPTLPIAYINYELDSSLSINRFDAVGGMLEPMQIVPSVPDTFVGANTSAEVAVHPSGKFVFVSNRGSDLVGSFAIDQATGRVHPIGWVRSGGKGPRFMVLDPSGMQLHVANELTDSIVTLSIDSETGVLRDTGRQVATESPTCVVFRTA